MRKLDVKEIHGYESDLGLKLIRTDRLGASAKRAAAPKAAEKKAAAPAGKPKSKR
jgi:hypothetical protein